MKPIPPRPALGALSGPEDVIDVETLPRALDPPAQADRFAPAEPGPVVARPLTSTSRRAGWWSPALAMRGFRRHPWVTLAVTVVGMAGLIVVADRSTQPRSVAMTLVRVAVADPAKTPADFGVFKQTQARRIANPVVLADALDAHPELQAVGPEGSVEIQSHVVDGTDLIQVELAGPSAPEACRIVDAVVAAFLKKTAREDGEIVKKGERLREARDRRETEVTARRAEVVALAGRLGAVDTARARDRDAVALEQYKVLSNQMLRTDLELMEAQAKLDRAQAAGRQPADADRDRGKIDAAVVTAFYADPEVATLRGQVDAAKDQLAQIDRIAKSGTDSTRGAARRTVEDGQRQIDGLWNRKKAALTQAARSTAQPTEAETRQAAERVNELRALTTGLGERLGRLNAQTKSSGADELTLEFARQDLSRSEAVLGSLTAELERHEIDARGAVAGFHQEFPARATRVPDGGKRLAALVLGPMTWVLLVVGIMGLVEARSARVMGPADLPGNLQPRVLGILPTLPRPVGSNRPADPRRRDDFARFVQSLDHLRAVLCDRRDHHSRRCLLITSAAGGEGKTTLAAQLAERCVSSGLSTLLIDADFRNPSLSRMFQRGEDRGLADILRGETEAEQAIGVLGDAGGVHFLPAGTDRSDPGRLLRADGLGQFLLRARESFDMVLVDSPPVLPVPDALTLGRWVDAAVLSVRADRSRFPWVEEADMKLAAVGVPVLGAVIQGVRDAGKGYGPPETGSPIVTQPGG